MLVTPALASANNGNWQTAARYARLLAAAYRVRVVERYTPAQADDAQLMIALHARRSAASIRLWRAQHPARPLVIVLTGTDLYRDIDTDGEARAVLDLADRLVLLNERGAERLPPALWPRARVVLQSCAERQPGPKPQRFLRAVAVGHLREEKDPRTLFAAVQRLAHRPDIRIDHLGAALDPALGAEAAQLALQQPQYRWLGARGHAEARRRIAGAHLLVHMSRMEGGAHVVIEALRSGTPVLASRIDGNLGLLGADYPGVFEPGDAAGLATLLERARDEPTMLPTLAAAAAARAPLFAPEAERAALHALLAELNTGDPAP